MNPKRLLSSTIRQAGIGLVLLVLIVVFAVIAPNFTSINNVRNIFTQITMNTILAVGVTYVILMSEIDLSVGSVMALSAVAGALVMTDPTIAESGAGLVLGMVVSILTGIVCGFLNGFVTANWRLPSFIVTLGMLNIARGAALYITQARTIFDLPRSLTAFGSGTLVEDVLPWIFVVALVLVVVGQFILSRSVFGRYVLAIGNNQEAVRLSGHNPARYKIIAFVLCGATAGIASIIYMARLTIANPNLGAGFELNAIAAVIIGGTSLRGGRGSVFGTLLGASLLGVLTNGLILMGVGDFVRQMVTGVIIVAAVIFDTYRERFAARGAEQRQVA